MMKKTVQKWLSIALAAAMTVTLAVGCAKGGDGGSKAKESQEFTWWITTTDSAGKYYDDYKDSASVQYINQQYWNTEEGGIGTAENGTNIKFDFIVPIAGSEQDNFNNMISTGEYPEVIDLAITSDSPQTMAENGVLMDITEYVEQYMPNYRAYLDAHPEMKPLVQTQADDGSVHYYALYRIGDSVREPWEGTLYRRDWVVEYAVPTEYVWDWESDYVKENGHPEVTPLDKAVEEDNLNGWKKNEVTKFEADYGENPDEDYTDNVIFPSGTADPITISDWEWMFEAFDKAIADRGWADDSNAYGTSISYMGNSTLGDLVSSFGGGTGLWYIKDGKVSFDGTSENFATYVECMQNWYEKGWLDQSFYTRAADMFYMINQPSISQGKIGLWCNYHGNSIGTTIRQTCLDERDQKNAFAMPAALPINDMYGSEEQMYKEPDALYQDSLIAGKVGITTKCEGKDLAALFTFLDWTYTTEGAEVLVRGLTKEQAESIELDPNIYKEYGIDCSYTKTTNEEGKVVYTQTFPVTDPEAALIGATNAARMNVGIAQNNTSEEYINEDGAPVIYKKAYELWGKYLNTGGTMNYTSLLNAEESTEYSKMQTKVVEYMSQNLPVVIQGKMEWKEYKAEMDKLDADSVSKYLQKYIDLVSEK